MQFAFQVEGLLYFQIFIHGSNTYLQELES
jgi:hypothetical protein